MLKDHSDSEKGNPLPPHGLLLPFNSKGSFICTIHRQGAGRSSEVERSLMVRGVVGSILHGRPIEQFLLPASAPRLVQQRPLCVVLSVG